MNSNEQPLESLFEKAEDYSKTTLEVIRLKAISKTAEVLSTLVAQMALLVAIALASLTINIGVALWVGKLLHNIYFGFYTIIAILLYFFKNSWIKIPVRKGIISILFEQ